MKKEEKVMLYFHVPNPNQSSLIHIGRLSWIYLN